MFAYKGFQRGLKCRGYQFSMGKNVTEAANCGQNGFHCAENPLDCLSYYGNVNFSDYCLVIPGGDMDEDQAAGLAKYIATQLGNKNTDNIQILDSNSNVLFSGDSSDTNVGTANSQLSVKSKAENLVKSKVKDVMVGSSLFDHVEVAPELVMDFDTSEEATHEYYAPDGQTNGMVGSKSEYESESEGGAAATPGTDSNDDTSYVIEDNNYTHSTVNYADSSVSLVATKYRIYDEDTLRASGALDNMTFDEYVAANSDPTAITVDPEYITMISNATGIPTDKITIIAQEEPVFQYSSGGRSASDYLQIVLVVLILLLLGYVVFRSTRKEKVAEIEPELSVESLLESTKESQEEMQDIGYNEKSETRILIEKFVEDNPEAAASLLRNWLNEEWE